MRIMIEKYQQGATNIFISNLREDANSTEMRSADSAEQGAGDSIVRTEITEKSWEGQSRKSLPCLWKQMATSHNRLLWQLHHHRTVSKTGKCFICGWWE